MSILSALVDVANDIKKLDIGADIDTILDDDEDSVRRVPRAASYDSIAKQSKNSVMQFPFLVSRSMSFDVMQMMAKAGERNYAAFLQTLVTMNMISGADSPQEFMRQFHQNSNNTINGPSDVATFIFNSTVPKEDIPVIMENVKYGNFTVEKVFNVESLNDLYLPEDAQIYGFTTEARKPIEHHHEHHHDHQVNLTDRRRTNVDARHTSHVTVNTGGNATPKFELPRNVYVDADAKKSNEMMPTMIQVRMYRDTGNGKGEFIDFLVGVKATIHPIESDDMINHIVSVFQDRGSLFKLIKWTTGEISFFKDLVLNIPDIKNEIKGIRSGESSKWWSALKNIKAKRRLNKFTLREPVLPNASIVISSEEVEYIRANYGFDIMEDDEAIKLIKNLNILAFYVVDASSEVVYTMIDGSDHYDINTFKGLERENGNADRQFKEMLKAVNKL
jgi:hypothetical protein